MTQVWFTCVSYCDICACVKVLYRQTVKLIYRWYSAQLHFRQLQPSCSWPYHSIWLSHSCVQFLDSLLQDLPGISSAVLISCIFEQVFVLSPTILTCTVHLTMMWIDSHYWSPSAACCLSVVPIVVKSTKLYCRSITPACLSLTVCSAPWIIYFSKQSLLLFKAHPEQWWAQLANFLNWN